MNPPDPDAARSLFTAHPRRFEGNRYVYPVLSRRSGGISAGVNLNLDKSCNFDCIYCQVDRRERAEKRPLDLDLLAAELDRTLESITSGRIYRATKFRDTPDPLRRLRDIAISGDGEPTLCPRFEAAVKVCVEVRDRRGLSDVSLVLITNAALFDRPRVRRGLQTLDAAGGEIWAKLDAGTEAHYRAVARSAVAFRQILDNLVEVARVRPIVIQSLFMHIDGRPPSVAEQEAYCGRLNEITAAGGRIKLVQIHTIARPPAESRATPLTPPEVDAVAERVRQTTGLPVASFYG